MARISQKTIEAIKSAADIIDVVGDYVALQPAGKNHKGLCPFHNEKTPSFMVSKERNSFHCFGCQEKGDAITFIQKIKNVSYVDALKLLAEKYRIPIETETGEEWVGESHRYYQINEDAKDFYALHLTNLEKGKSALEYLKARGLDIHTIQYFEIGFAPKEPDALYRHLKNKYEEIEMLAIGLIKAKDPEGYIDLFRDRIIFPIRNERGKIVGFSGRTFKKETNDPKYVNSPFTEIFSKGETLYNLDRAQPFIRQKQRLVLTEGFMDVIAAVKAGVKETICAMGTALTHEHAELIKRYTPQVVLCFDGDNAGFQATAKAIPIMEKAGLDVRVVVLPEELDPDDYQKKYGANAFLEQINQHQIDSYDFLYLTMKKGRDLKLASQIEQFKLKVFEYLLQNASGTLSDLFLEQFARDTKVSIESVRSDFNSFRLSKAIKQSLNDRKQRHLDVAFLSRSYQAERILINYYMKDREYRSFIEDQLPGFFASDNLNNEILGSIQDILERGLAVIDHKTIISQFSDEKKKAVEDRLFRPDHEFSKLELEQSVHSLKMDRITAEIDSLKKQLIVLDSEQDRLAYLELHQKILDLEKIRRGNKWKKTK
ncbi:MAG: DNA primase [Candidatus Izemoplasmatales bacterium]|nr:DNA primase [Candidatus Izemoplasmatales bacterium]